MKAGDCAQDQRIWQIDDIVADVFHMLLQQSCGMVGDAAAAAHRHLGKGPALRRQIEAQCLVEFPQAESKNWYGPSWAAKTTGRTP